VTSEGVVLAWQGLLEVIAVYGVCPGGPSPNAERTKLRRQTFALVSSAPLATSIERSLNGREIYVGAAA
jgi:hypothetical protein